MFTSKLLITCFALYMLYNMLKIFFTSLPFHSLCSCLAFSFAMITLLVGADGANPGDRSDGGSIAV